jgi:hypothetical protein
MSNDRISSHRPNAIQLPDDPREAAAGAVALIRGEDAFDRAAGAEALTRRIELLTNPDSDEALDEFTAHLPVLEALFLRFACEASVASRPQHQAALLKISLAAQAAYARTSALIAALRLQREGKASVSLMPSEDIS